MRAHHHQHRSRSSSVLPFLGMALAVSLCSSFSSCAYWAVYASPLGGKLSSEYGRDEFVQLVKEHPWNWDNMYYRGTDARYHHFITRIGGNTQTFVVPVSELTLSSTKPVNEHLIEIHPEDGFRMGPGTFVWY